jgi:hypothetical protein
VAAKNSEEERQEQQTRAVAMRHRRGIRKENV